MMKKLAHFGVLSFAVFLASASFLSFEALAVSGSCKSRNSQDEMWKTNGLDFNTCEQQNKQVDGDNIFDPIGLIYWDSVS